MRYTNIKYVDPSIATGGDGAAPSTALKALPSLSSNLENDTMYLIRRTAETSFVSLPGGRNNNITKIAFIGMPKPEDPLYNYVPALARTEWGSDQAEYAQLHVGSYDDSENSGGTVYSYIATNGIVQFEMSRINFQKETVSVSGHNQYSCFYFDGGSNPLISFTNNRFCGLDEPLDTTFANQPTSGKHTGYLYAQVVADVFTCSNNVICYQGTSDYDSGYSMYAFYVYRVNGTYNMCNNTIYACSSGDYKGNDGPYGQASVFYFESNQTYNTYRNINNHVYYILTNGKNWPGIFNQYSNGGCRDAIFKNFTVEAGREISTPTEIGIVSPIFRGPYGARFYEVDNINITVPKCWYTYTYDKGLIEIRGSRANTCYHSIKNITVNFAETDGLGAKCDSNNSDKVDGDYYYRGFVVWLMALDNVENVTVNHLYGKGIYLQNSRVSNITCKGTFSAYHSTAKVNSITVPRDYYACVLGCSSKTSFDNECFVEIDNIILDQTTPTEDKSVVYYYDAWSMYNGNVFIKNCPKLVYPLSPLQPTQTNENIRSKNISGCMTVLNNGEEGHLTVYHSYNLCDTWSAHRNGGNAKSLKFSNNASNYLSALTLGRIPQDIFVRDLEAAGTYQIEVYVALINSPDWVNRFWFEFETDSDFINSATNGAWVDDTSVWSETGSGAVSKKFVGVIKASAACKLTSRIFFNYYSAEGCAYLDPTFVVTKLS